MASRVKNRGTGQLVQKLEAKHGTAANGEREQAELNERLSRVMGGLFTSLAPRPRRPVVHMKTQAAGSSKRSRRAKEKARRAARARNR